MVHVTRRMMMAAVVAQLMRQRQRARERAFEIRKLQLSWLATQPFPVLLVMANSAAGQARRVVPRALGKWRGSTLSGYLKHDDQTYVERFRATRAQLDGLVVRLQGSQLDTAENQLVRVTARGPAPPPSAAFLSKVMYEMMHYTMASSGDESSPSCLATSARRRLDRVRCMNSNGCMMTST